MSTKAIRNTIIGLFFATLTVPFIVFLSSYFPYVVGKAFIFRIIVSIMLILWGLLCFKDSKFLPSKNGITLSFLALIIFYFISNLLGPEFIYSTFGNFERMMGWVSMAVLFLFFLVISSVIKEKKIWNYYFFAQIFSSLILLVMGLRELSANGIGFRIETTLNNPIYLSIIFLFSIFFALYLLFENYQKWIKILLLISILLNGLGIFFTGTRGTMLGLFVSVFLLSIYFLIKYWNIKKIRVIGVSFLAIIVLVPTLIIGFKDSSFMENNSKLGRLSEINFSEGTGYARLMNWEIAWKGIKENPIFGWGQMNYVYVFDKYYNPELYIHEQFFDSSHNTYLDIWLMGGLFSLVSYLLLLVFSLFYVFKKTNINEHQRFILAGLLIAYFVQNIFVFDNITSFILFFTLLAFIISNKENGGDNLILKRSLPILSIIFAVLIITVLTIIPWKSNNNLMKGLRLLGTDASGTTVFFYENGIQENKRFFEKALGGNFTGLLEIKNIASSLLSYFPRINTNDPKIISDMQDFSNFSIGLLIEEVQKNPDSAQKTVILAKALNGLGSLEQAEIYAQRAVELSPNRQLYWLLLSDIKNKLGKTEEYLEITKKIYELDKTNDRSWLNYIIAINEFDKEELQSLSEELKEEENLKKLENTFDILISGNPDNYNFLMAKIEILANIGLFDLALKNLDEFDLRFPNLESETSKWRASLEKGEVPE